MVLVKLVIGRNFWLFLYESCRTSSLVLIHACRSGD